MDLRNRIIKTCLVQTKEEMTLDPCPLCGQEPMLNISWPDAVYFSLFCTCGLAPPGGGQATPDDAVKTWNAYAAKIHKKIMHAIKEVETC